ncbi:DUF89 domain-containing protein [Planctomycetota bacterium]
MNATLDCLPCFLRQTLDAVRMSTDDQTLHEDVMRKVLYYACTLDLKQCPPWICYQILRYVEQLTGKLDPYREKKDHVNRAVLRMVEGLQQRITLSSDPLETAVRLAIAGNVIDFGVYRDISVCDIERSIDHCLSATLVREALLDFRKAIESATDILYLADNTGEIVLDRLLIETMNHPRVTLVVRGGPILNDATRADAEAVGLTRWVNVIDNGSRVPGTVLEDCSPAFRECFQAADLVIAKGQGNYESLDDSDKRIYFLLKAKCAFVADGLGCAVGDMVLHSGPSGAVAEVGAKRRA